MSDKKILNDLEEIEAEASEDTSKKGSYESEEEEEDPYIIKFDKPFEWEGKIYTQIDLSGLEDLTAQDMISVQRQMSKAGSMTNSVIPETSVEYACLFAAKALKMPVEFLNALPAKVAARVKLKVTNFFFGEE